MEVKIWGFCFCSPLLVENISITIRDLHIWINNVLDTVICWKQSTNVFGTFVLFYYFKCWIPKFQLSYFWLNFNAGFCKMIIFMGYSWTIIIFCYFTSKWSLKVAHLEGIFNTWNSKTRQMSRIHSLTVFSILLDMYTEDTYTWGQIC
jgi:hypothetical protein